MCSLIPPICHTYPPSATGLIWPTLQYKFSTKIGTNTIWCMPCNNKSNRRHLVGIWSIGSRVASAASLVQKAILFSRDFTNIFFQVNVYDKLWIYYWSYAKYFFLQNKITLFRNSFFPSASIIKCDALPDLVPFVQFKKREKHLWSSVTFSKLAGF